MSKTTKIVEQINTIQEELLGKEMVLGTKIVELKNRIAEIAVLFADININQSGSVYIITYEFNGEGHKLEIHPDSSLKVFKGGVGSSDVIGFIETLELFADEAIKEEMEKLTALETKLKETN